MRTSYQLLKQYLNIQEDPLSLAKKLTQQGLEVEEIIPYANNLDKMIIVQVIDKKNHPNADHLSICSVQAGKEILQIVCGAKNFQINDKVVLAPVGTIMPNGTEIQISTIRGEKSHGMLCSSKELGLFDSEGLWVLEKNAPIGESVISYYNISPDTIYDISLTPNRGDCLGTLGIAREVSILEQKSATSVHVKQRDISIHPDIPVPIVNINSQYCKRYTSRIVRNIVVQESPIWLKVALKKYGLHSVNNIVDISNYIMMELGQPVHIFDADKISFPISITDSSPNETLVVLSGKELSVPPNSIIIKDTHNNISLAGIMGGLESSISTETKNLFLEVASFGADTIRQTAKLSNIHTDASYRFVRNTDIENIPTVMDFLTQLILDVSPGEASAVLDSYPNPEIPKIIDISLDFVEKKLGFSIPEIKIQEILHQLGFSFEVLKGQYRIKIPSYRNDCHIKEDIVEEIIRIYGYDKMPITAPKLQIPLDKPLPKKPFILQLKELLVSYGLQEIYTFSLTKKEWNQEFSLLGEESIPLKNPLNTDLSYLRTSLFSTVAPYIQGILQKGAKTFHGFEVGNIFYQTLNQEFKEDTHLLLFQMGERTPLNFKKSHGLVDFYDTKNKLEQLFKHLNLSSNIDFRPLQTPLFLHPYKTAGIYYLDTYLGFIGEIVPKFWNGYKGKNNLVISEINLSKLENLATFTQIQRSYTPISKYPKIERDLAFVLSKDILSSEIVKKIQSLSPLIVSVESIDSYEHEKLGENKRSLGFKIFFQSSTQTLTDLEIQPLIQEIIQWVTQEKNGVLREF